MSYPKYRYRANWSGKLILQEYFEDMDMDACGSPIITSGYKDVIVNLGNVRKTLLNEQTIKDYPLPIK